MTTKFKQPFRVGDRIFEKQRGYVAMVTEHTERGFRYKFDKPVNAAHPLLGQESGGECYAAGFDGWEKWTGKNRIFAQYVNMQQIENAVNDSNKRFDKYSRVQRREFAELARKLIRGGKIVAPHPATATATEAQREGHKAIEHVLRCLAFVKRLARQPCKVRPSWGYRGGKVYAKPKATCLNTKIKELRELYHINEPCGPCQARLVLRGKKGKL